ncbi:MAG: phosphatase PAP2 family protein [Bacteroidales bacterium]|nr:phosphatase PAP2 family protein [Bacteroidales bacterium]
MNTKLLLSRNFSCLMAVWLLHITGLPLLAQTADTCHFRINRNYLNSYWHATACLATRPLHYSGQQWVMAGGLTALAVVAYSQDEAMLTYFSHHLNGPQASAIEKWGSPLGNGLVAGPLLAGLYIYGATQNDSRSRQAALAGAQAFILGAGAAFLLKELTHRPRPDQLNPPNASRWFGPFKGAGYDAFPSGHSLRAFAVATVISGMYRDRRWVGITAYSLAGFAAFSRLANKRHWTSDVVAGAAIGYAIGRGVLLFNRQQSEHCFTTQLSENGLGLVLNF